MEKVSFPVPLEKWKQETEEAERRAAARIAEAQAKAAALAAGTMNPSMISPRPGGSADATPVAAAAASANAASIDAAPARGQGNIEDAIQQLESVSDDSPVTLYMNALYRDEESTSIVALTELREDVGYWTETGHKVARSGKYEVTVGDRTLRIPADQLLNDDFNELSDHFFFGTSPHLTLFTEENGGDELHVTDLTTLSPGVLYYLASGNNVEVIGGADPKIVLNGEKDVALPEEVAEQLRY